MMPSVLLALAVLNADPAGPTFTYRLKKADDRIQATLAKDAVTFRVTSPSGIGAGEAILQTGSWPRQVTLHLTLWRLEWFTVGNGKVVLQAALGGEAKRVLIFDKDGNAAKDPKLAVYSLTLEQKGKNLIEVTLPAGFCGKETRKLEFDWIDAFR
jgi:hypothetical protein